MRRFEVWLDKQVAGSDPEIETLEFADSTPQKQIDADCAACLQTMIANSLDTGWGEIDPKPAKKRRGEK